MEQFMGESRQQIGRYIGEDSSSVDERGERRLKVNAFFSIDLGRSKKRFGAFSNRSKMKAHLPPNTKQAKRSGKKCSFSI